jgi:hypothetical protein
VSNIPPAGVTPASAFSLQQHAVSEPPPAILADQIDPATGEYLSIVDSATIADGLVVHLLRTQRGSGAAVLSFGQRYRELTHVTTDSTETVESMTREALQPAADAGVVRFDQIEAEIEPRDGSQLNTGIQYTDLLAPRRDAERTFTFTE